MTFEEQHLITDSEFVVCKICGKETNLIGNKHLKKYHNLTLEEYRKSYPNEPTITKLKFEKDLISIENRKIGKKEIEGKTKEVPCHFHPDRIVVVNINQSKTGLCYECKAMKRILPSQAKAIESMNKTIKETYNVDNISQIQEVKEKKKIKHENKTEEEKKQIVINRTNTLIETFGKDWGKEINNLSKKGMVKKYGKEYPLQVPEINEKLKETWKDKPQEEIVEMIKKNKHTKLEKYGDENFNNIDQIKKTNQIIRNVEWPTQDPEVIILRKENNLKKYNYEETLSIPEIRQQIDETNFKKRGKMYPTQDPNVIETRRENSINKIGVDNHMKLPEYKNDFSKRELNRFINSKFSDLQKEYNVEFCDLEYLGAKYPHKFKCIKCGSIFTKSWWSIKSSNYKCEICYPRNTGSSVPEHEIGEYLKSIGFENLILNSKKIIPPMELDIYIPVINIAFEYNGLYYHSDNYLKETRGIENPKLYHFNKVEECIKKEIKLIHIYEDEWIYKRNLVKNNIKLILNKFDGEILESESLIIKELANKNEKDEFLNLFHHDPNDNSEVLIGAYLNDELLSIMTFIKTSNDTWILSRFCTDYNYYIYDIEKSLLEYFKSNYSWSSIITYYDRRWKDESIYLDMNFEKTKEDIKIDYWFLKNSKRINVENFDLEFPDKEKKDLEFIWDCGSTKFILKH